jgi:cytochrome bd-type quinol oxidase subunit 2
MTRIFSTLASLLALALATSFLAGVASKLRDAAHNPNDSLYLVHFTLGLFTAIGALLIHCIIFTYFLGTGRWVKEVKLAYELADEPLPKLTRELKRRTFPPALAAMLITIATAAAGAGAQLKEWPWMAHASLAVATLVINLWAFRIEYRNIRMNAGVIDNVLREVDRIRAERGLPSNAEALRQTE